MYILCYIIVILEIIWWYTCTQNKEIPLLIQILGTIFALIPGVHVVCTIAVPVMCYWCYKDGDLKLKNNC